MLKGCSQHDGTSSSVFIVLVVPLHVHLSCSCKYLYVICDRLARGNGQVVNGDKDIVYTHKDLSLQET